MTIINNIEIDNIRYQKNDKISFVDFGLADIMTDCNNDDNCYVFIELLEILQNKFKNMNTKQIHVLYNTFMNNIRNNNKYPKNVF